MGDRVALRHRGGIMTSALVLPEQFFMKAEVEEDNSGNPKQEPESFHRAHLSQPAGQVITI
jgi:hypothetical protein